MPACCIAFPCMFLNLKNRSFALVCDEDLDIKWHSPGKIESFVIQWDVRITGRKMRIQIDPSLRATDIRFLYLGLSEVFASLMPLINNLSQKCRDEKFSFFCNYTNLRNFLNELKVLSYAMLLCGGEPPHFEKNPKLKVEILNELVGKDLTKVKSKRRLPLLVKAWKDRINLLIELLSKNIDLLFLEYYLDGKLMEYPIQWLEEIVNIVEEARSLGFKVFFPLKEKNLFDVLKGIPLNVTLVEPQSLKLYESLLEVTCGKAQNHYSLFDIVGYLYGNPSPAYMNDMKKLLDELVSCGVLKKIEGKYVIE